MQFLKHISSFCLTLAVFVAMAGAQSTKTIPLNKTTTTINKELYSEFIYLNKSSTLTVNFTDINNNISFIVFQVHSHLYNVSLMQNSNNKTLVKGMNLGLQSPVEDLGSFVIENRNLYQDLKLLLIVLGYYATDPIPGGCSLEVIGPASSIMTAKTHDKTYIVVDASPPRDEQNDPNCTKKPTNLSISFKTRFYMMYLPEQNFKSEAYFEVIKNMTTLKSIEQYGYEMPATTDPFTITRRIVSAYPGSGVVFVAVAEKEADKIYSVYVPTHSYACSPLVENDCSLLEDALSMCMSVILFFLGIGLCYFGHWFFKTQIVSVGFMSGFIVSYIVLSLIFAIDNSAIVQAATISGLCIGGLRLVCWWLYGIPAYIICLTAADLGFLLASMLYYVSPGGLYLTTNLNFWCLFVLIILLTTLFLLWASHVSSMVCTAVIGGYTAIYPLDYYMGSNLKYIINNTVRRAIVPIFRKAIIFPPCQWRDIFLIVIWALLAISGFLYQYYYNKGRPPFPPPPRSVRAVPEDSTIPQLRRRSSVALFWAIWVSRCRQRRTSSFVRNVNERTPLLEDQDE